MYAPHKDIQGVRMDNLCEKSTESDWDVQVRLERGPDMLVTIKFRLDHTWDDYMDVNNELLLDDMMDRIASMKEGIEPIEIENIEYETI